jgi:hypothetical protein
LARGFSREKLTDNRQRRTHSDDKVKDGVSPAQDKNVGKMSATSRQKLRQKLAKSRPKVGQMLAGESLKRSQQRQKQMWSTPPRINKQKWIKRSYVIRWEKERKKNRVGARGRGWGRKVPRKKVNAGGRQGDQIGRICADWMIVYFGIYCLLFW